MAVRLRGLDEGTFPAVAGHPFCNDIPVLCSTCIGLAHRSLAGDSVVVALPPVPYECKLGSQFNLPLGSLWAPYL